MNNNKLGDPLNKQKIDEIENIINESLKNAEIKTVDINNQAELDKIYDQQIKMIKEETKNPPKPKHFKNFNAQLTLDNKNNSVYIYIPPNMTKTPIKPDKHELVQGEFGHVYLDYSGGKIIGVEILDADKYFELK